MVGLLKAIRLPECLLVVLLGFLGFLYSGVPVHPLTLFTLFSVIASTMLQNDWSDRHHDLAKGKVFALENPRLFLIVCFFSWFITFGLVFWFLSVNLLTGTMLLMMSLIGLFYSEARQVPVLSLFLVTITVASSTLLALGFGASLEKVLLLTVCVGLLMLGRENLHDIADVVVDRDYKKTLPIVFGDKVARIVSLLSLLTGGLLAILITTTNIPGALCIFWGLTRVMSDSHVVTVRKRIDIGFALLAIGFLVPHLF